MTTPATGDDAVTTTTTARLPAREPADGDSWYRVDGAEVARRLGVDSAVGLSSHQAAELLQRHGPNALPVEASVPGWKRFLDQYRTYMQLILVAAAIVSLAIKEWSTGVLLLLITVLNAVVGLRQEGKAESAMNALKAMVKASARVRRDGTEAQIPAEEVAVGDVVLLAAGDDVPADGRIIQASSLQIDEAALTGESVPVSKGVQTPEGTDLGPADQTNMAFMHTPVTHGSGVMIVTATGSDTQVGKIAGMLARTAREQTPLSRQLNTLTLWIAAAAGITMVIMFVLGAQRGLSSTIVFSSAVALAIAAIPEAMPTVLQVVMSVGAADLATHGAVLKDLASVETLGSTSAINSDKTGTLTMNQMTAVEVVDPTDRYTISGSGYELDGSVHHAAGSSDTIEDAILPYVVASDATLVDGKVVGDPTEGALLVLANKAGLDIAATHEQHPRLATLPFDPTYKLMAAFTSGTDADGRETVRCYVKGAAPAVMSHAATALSAGQSIPWDNDLRDKAEAHVDRMEKAGLRVMAAAFRDLAAASFDPDGDLLGYVEGLEMTSLVGMVDPPRAASKQAVHDAHNAHIRVRMVTGDDVVTGAAIAEQLGIEGEAMLGAEFAALDESERLERIDRIGIVGRVAPEHKVLLAETLKKQGEVVAMTGDGVNDAPSIKAAHIGIAMGSGTEVAKNAARMILTDDDFATIVRAVEQGRKLYDNLMKYVRFVLISLVAFVLTFLGATILNIAAGQPFTPAQVLYIHFFVGAPFGVALGLDQATPGLMTLRPRPSTESIVTTSVKLTSGLVGLYMAICLDALIYFGKEQYHSTVVGASIGLSAFALMLIVAAFESRSATRSSLVEATFNNPKMNWTAIAELALAVMITQMDLFNRLLDTTPLKAPQFGLAVGAAVLLLALWEVGKLIARRRESATTSGSSHPSGAAFVTRS
jgi:P-type Ca2+ transporter type 2C